MDDLDIAGLWFFGSILVFALLFVAVRAFVMWIDSNSPLNRDDRRQLRSVRNGKRAMAGER